MSQETRRLARDLAAHLEWQRLLGVGGLAPGGTGGSIARAATAGAIRQSAGLPGGPPITAGRGDSPGVLAEVIVAGEPMRPVAIEAARPATTGTAAAGVEPEVAAARSLDALRGVIGDCRRCRLHGARTNVVFGVGDPKARIVFVGEGPGQDEDLRGEPFVGRAGQLLTDIIEKGMRLRREDVYICNVVKCRPPQNRNPEPDEVATCSPFLFRQIELVGPEVLVTLGKFAAQALLSTKTPITQMRGRWQEFRGIPVMPTFHPAYLLRNPAEKKTVWQDIQLVMARLGLGR